MNYVYLLGLNLLTKKAYYSEPNGFHLGIIYFCSLKTKFRISF